MEVEYVGVNIAVWIRKFLTNLKVVPNMHLAITLYCGNSGAIANLREPRSHKREKHIEDKYHLTRKVVHCGDVGVTKISFEQNIVDPVLKTIITEVFKGHV